jgi:hypothetical protein
MIVFKEEFIKRYTERLKHKVEQELKEKLPDSGYFAEWIDKANETTREIVKT